MREIGNWAVIDIETTGIDPAHDEIIDIGFLYFEGLELKKKFSSLIRPEYPISYFIQKLTGITNELLKKAPPLKKIEDDLECLKGAKLFAHNASFEEGFLAPVLDRIPGEIEDYEDSLLLLPLIFPKSERYSLEHFINLFGLRESEVHRGYEDALDMLKVVLLSAHVLSEFPDEEMFLKDFLNTHGLNDFWPAQFLHLSSEQREQLAQQIDLNLDRHAQVYFASQNKMGDFEALEKKYPLEFSGKNIQKILSDEEGLSQKLSKYTFRKAQVEMSLRVGQAFKNNIHALIQAPTGTGKTLGYLIPSILKAKHDDEKVLIATGTKALQTQAFEKDIPTVRKILGLNESELRVEKLFGSSNHLCELKYRKLLGDSLDLLEDSFDFRFAKVYFDRLFHFNQCHGEAGEFIIRENVSSALKRMNPEIQSFDKDSAVDFRSCLGSKCAFKNNCSYIQGLRRAREANLIIGNHSLLFRWPRAFDRPNYIVIDEAHRIEGEATSNLTRELSLEDFEKQIKGLPSLVGPLFYILGQKEGEKADQQVHRIRKESLDLSKFGQDQVELLKESIEDFFKKQPRYTDTYWNEVEFFDQRSALNQLEEQITFQIQSLHSITKDFYDLIAPYALRYSVSDFGDDENLLTAWAGFENTMTIAEEIHLILNDFVKNDDLIVPSLKYHATFGGALSSAPVNPGEVVFDHILKESASVIFTSATLGNHYGDVGMSSVEWMTGYSYLDSEKRFKSGLFLDNKFDYQNNAKVFLATDVPSIYDTDYVPHVLERIIPLIKELEGKSLLLFSSKLRFEMAREILLEKIDPLFPLFSQGMGKSAVDDFKKAGSGVLLGMESYGEGIDLPGDLLKFVYIDKIPDIRQDKVIVRRREFFQRTFGNEFVDYFLSSRCRNLHQKLGRLLRTETDSGVVIITDPRIQRWKGKTLGTFNDLMKPYELSKMSLEDSVEQAISFLKNEGKTNYFAQRMDANQTNVNLFSE